MRCFVGWLLPEKCREDVWVLVEKVRKLPLRCKVVEKENLHINFSFLGELDERKTEDVWKKVEDVSHGIGSIRIFVDGVKLIPSERKIRVIALHVVSDELVCFVEKINKALFGKAKHPHITLCRVKEVYERNKIVEFASKNSLDKEYVINSVQLIKSVLRPSGPEYTVLREIPLR